MREDLATIWRRVLEDDDQGWRDLVALFAPFVFSIARQCGLSRPEAEDCSQQVWISLYRNRRLIRDPLRLPAWLRRTARRRALRIVEQKSARETREYTHGEQRPLTVEPANLEEMEDHLLLETAISQLDPRCRWLLHALFFSHEDRTYEDIARALALSPNALGPLRSRCLERLKRILTKLGYRVD